MCARFVTFAVFTVLIGLSFPALTQEAGSEQAGITKEATAKETPSEEGYEDDPDDEAASNEEPASSEQVKSARSQRAVQLGKDGIALYNQRRWVEAFDKFAAAEAAAHSPVLVLFMARSKRNAGELLAARAHYLSITQDVLSEDSPLPWRKAQQSAIDEQAALLKRIPTLTITLNPPSDRTVAVQIDGRLLASAQLGSAFALDPGPHRITALRAGQIVASRSIRLGEGVRGMPVQLTIPPVTPGPPPGTSVAPPPPQPLRHSPPADTATSTSNRGSLLPGAITLGLGVSGLIVGAVTGGNALSKANEVKSGCDITGNCNPNLKSSFDDASTLAHTSTAAFIAGGVISAAGITLLIWRPGGDDSASAERGSRPPFTIGVRRNGVAVDGHF